MYGWTNESPILYNKIVDLTELDFSWLQNSRYLPSHHAITTVDLSYLDNLLAKVKYLKNVTLIRQYSNYTATNLCGSVMHIHFIPEKWVMLPCNDVLFSNYFLCENKLPTPKSQRSYLSKRTPYHCGNNYMLISLYCFSITKYSGSINVDSVFFISESLNRYLTRWSLGNDLRNFVIIINLGIVEHLVTYDLPQQRIKSWHQMQFYYGVQLRYSLNRRAVHKYTQDCNIDRHYACPDSTCILISYVCDGVVDCADGRDEMACENILCANNTECQDQLTITNCSCSHMHYRCYSDDCIRLDQLCDWRADCLDNSDEGHCNPHSDVHVDHFKWQIASDSIFEVNTIGMILY